MNASKVIFTLLSSNAGLSALLGSSSVTGVTHKIFRSIAPQKETAPFITYAQVGESVEHCAQGLAVRIPTIEVRCWADTPDDADEIAEAVIPILNNQYGTTAGQKYDNILYSNNIEIVETNLDPPLYGRVLEFQIRIA